MDNVSICVAFIAAILGIAYPILLEVVSRLDEKYSSVVVLDLFGKEKEKRFFTISLLASLGILLLYMLKLPPPEPEKSLDINLSGSAEILLVVVTIILIVAFFLFTRKVLIYYAPTRFSRYLEKRYQQRKVSDNHEVFLAIADLLHFSIRQQNEVIALSVSDFMYRAFMKIRDDQKTKEVVYPRPYYDTVYKTIEELANQANRRLRFLEHRTAGGVWILGETGGKISEISYDWLWQNILLAINYEKDDFILFYWEQAYQFKQTALKYIWEEHGDAPDFAVLNQKEINERNKERERFMEFHYVLGGLLLSQNRYKCLKRAFNFTQSIPPRYELLPETMGEIFRWYFEFSDPYDMKRPDFEYKYRFPELSGLNSGGIMKNWISEYMALLFLRQYTIIPHLVGMEPLRMPEIPKKQYEKKQWIDQLSYFKTSVERTLSNRALLETLELTFITKEWCEKHKHPYPLELIDKFIKDLTGSFHKAQEHQDISPDKLERFKRSSTIIIEPVLKHYGSVGKKSPLTGEYEKRFIGGLSHVLDKSAFADDQEAEHLNFDTIIAETFVKKFGDAVSEIFVIAALRSYLFPLKEVPAVISRLGASTKDFVLVSFGIEKTEITPLLNNAGINDLDYVQFNMRNYPFVGDSLFIIKKTDLPSFLYKKMNEEEEKKYDLFALIEDHNIYATVADLHKKPELKESLESSEPGRNFDKSVYAGIFMRLEVQWRKGAQWVQIKVASEYRPQGIPNKLADVQPIVPPNNAAT